MDRLVDGGNKEQGRYIGELLPRVWRWGFNRNPDVYPLNVEVAARLEKPQKENRQRYATEKEIKAILKHGSPVIKGALYMGQRVNETYRMEYADLVEGKKNWIQIPPEKMKSKRPHRVYITKTVWRLIKEHRANARTVNDRYCWCGYGSRGGGHISIATVNGDWTKLLQRLEKVKRPDEIKLQMRDLRRTLYTWIEENLKDSQTATAVAGHKKDGMGNIYGIYDYEDEKKKAMLSWEKYLNSLIKK